MKLGYMSAFFLHFLSATYISIETKCFEHKNGWNDKQI